MTREAEGERGVGRIFCLLGKSGTGKDTLFHLAMSTGLLRPLIPYTTRPRRFEEVDGLNYHFVTVQEMEQMEAAGQIIERRTYQTTQGPWHYFTAAAAALDPSADYLLITTPAALPAIVAYFGEGRVVGVLLEAEDQIRLERSIRREAGQPRPDFAEVCRRYLADEKDFAGPLFQGVMRQGYIDANCSPEDCLHQLRQIQLYAADSEERRGR